MQSPTVPPTADANSAAAFLASNGRPIGSSAEKPVRNAQPAVTGCSDTHVAGDRLQPSDRPAASLDLEDDDDLYRMYVTLSALLICHVSV